MDVSPAGTSLRAISINSWFTVHRKILEEFPARYWVFILRPKNPRFVVITSRELLKRIEVHHGRGDKYNLYFNVLDKNICWDLRALPRDKKKDALTTGRIAKSRNFSEFLDDWSTIQGELAV
jgi:hypothetical protein